MKLSKITFFVWLILAVNTAFAQYIQPFEPIVGNTNTIRSILIGQCWVFNNFNLNSGGVAPITGTQSMISGNAATVTNRGIITPYMAFDGSDSLSFNYKYYGASANNRTRWFLVTLINPLGVTQTIDSVFIDLTSNNVVNYTKNITGVTGNFKIFINYRGTGGNGRVGFDDFFFTGNYVYATGCVDSDNDAVIDTRDKDDDNDGIPDFVEVCGVGATSFSCLGSTPATSDPSRDADGDGIDNAHDADFCALNANSACSSLDFDGDGIPNYLDLDSDNDGIADAIEANGGIAPPNYLNGVIVSNVGGNGMPNSAETPNNSGITNFPMTNSDSDLLPDYLDTDSDNDGIVDLIEAQATFAFIPLSGLDSDKDGVDDAFDNIIGPRAVMLNPVNTDLLDLKDYRDTDAENDGRNDIIEAHDSNGNDIQDGTEMPFALSGLDSDNDGLDNNYDQVVGFSANNGGQVPNSFPNAQFGTPERDWREMPFGPEICGNGLDDDGDGFFDCADSDCTPIIDSILTAQAGPCSNGNNGSINIFATGASFYSIDSGNVFVNTSLFTNLPTGTYHIMVKSSGTCGVVEAINPIVLVADNCAPIAIDDSYSTNQNQPLFATTVLSNDDNTDGPSLNINIVPITSTANGSLIINIDGTFLYTPNNGFNGIDQFTYLVCDNAFISLCDTGLVTITVIPPVNILPIISNENLVLNISNNAILAGNILLNDSDADGTLSANILPVVNTSNGIFIIDTNGDFTYTPTVGFIGFDTAVVQVCDNAGACANDTIFIQVISTNIAPVVISESFNGVEDNAIVGNILSNDSDADGTLSVTINPLLAAAHGNIIINASGDFTYAPNANYNGLDTAIYAVCDNGGLCVNDTLFFNITPVNDAPIVQNENIIVPFNSFVIDNVLTNDLDVDGTLSALPIPIDNANNGTFSIAASGSFVYISNINFSGFDTIVVSVCDNLGLCVNDTIFIQVIDPNNQAPVVVSEHISTNEDTPFISNLLLNDTDIDGTITVTIAPILAASHGTVLMNANGNYTYTPNLNYFGNDTAIYKVCDNGNLCANDTLFITVLSINDLPVVTNEFFVTTFETTLTGNILLNDTDVETSLLVTIIPIINTSNGLIVMQTNGDFIYTPNLGFFGNDTAVYNICDLDGGCVVDTIIISVTPPPNQLPIIQNDVYTLDQNSFLSDNFLLNDSDPDGTISANINPVVNVNNGVLVYSSNGNFTYTPNFGFVGLDTAVIAVCDNNGACINDTLFFTVTPVNISPTINNESIVTNVDTPISGNILSNDSDPDGTLAVNVIPLINPSNGIITVDANGDFTYTPNAGFVGLDTLVMVVCDNSNFCVNDTIFVAVISPNIPPIINSDFYLLVGVSSLANNFMLNDVDIDGTLSAIIPALSNVSGGTLIYNAGGDFTYTPNIGFAGNDTALVQICDNNGACGIDTIVFKVIPNLPPIVNNEIFSTSIDVPINANILLNDSDADGTLSVNLVPVLNPSNGVFVFSVNGDFTYTPNLGFVGIDTMIVSVCDNANFCINDTIVVKVLNTNIAPDVNSETFNTSVSTAIAGNILLNDSDIDGTILVTLPVLQNPAHGTATVLANGDFTYTPSSGFTGSDLFIVLVCDNNNACEADTIFINILSIFNSSPTVLNETFNTVVDQVFIGNILLNDSDIEGPLSVNVTPVVDLQNGTIIMQANGSFNFIPSAGFVGTDFAVFNVCDIGGICVLDTVTFIVSPIANVLPTIVNDSYNTSVNTPFTNNFLLNDVDPDGTLTANVVPISTTSNGTFVYNSTGDFTYTPNLNFVGIDMAVIQVCDNSFACAFDTIFISVHSTNNIPVVNNESFITPLNTAITANVLLNDSDVEGPLTVDITPVLNPANGTLIINANGDFTYTPNNGFSGSDTMIVSVCDNSNFCINDTIFVTIDNGNNLPLVQNETFNTIVDQAFIGNILLNDFDIEGPLTVDVVPLVDLQNGIIIMQANGSFNFIPGTGFIGNDFAVFNVCDADGACAVDTVFFVVGTVPNIPPVIVNDFYNVFLNTPLVDNFLINDFDIDGTLTVNLNPVVNPINGIIVYNTAGDFTYTPNIGFMGTDMVVIQICDNSSSCSFDTLNFNVTSIIMAPTVLNENFTTDEDVLFAGNVTANDVDIQGVVSASTILVLNPLNGIVTINANGDFTYTPNANFNGLDTIIFSVCNVSNICVNDTVIMTINPVNDAIIITNENIIAPEEIVFSGSIILNDTDIDATTITVNTTPIVPPSNGTIVISANGNFDYLPNVGYNGNDTVVVTVCDSGFPLPITCGNDTIFITVIPFNNPPIIVNDAVTTNEDITVSGTVLTIDSDPEGTTLTADTIPVFGPLNGTIVINQNGGYSYIPNSNFNGIDTVVVQICDNGLPLPAACAFDTLIITVIAVNDAPIIANDTITTLGNVAVSSTIINANDFDIENTLLTADTANVSGPSNGTFIINTNGSYTYTPNNGFYGTDTVIVSICDAGLPLPALCTADTLFIIVTPVASIADAGADFTACADTATLAGNMTPVGTGIWTVIVGGATVVTDTLFNSTVTNLSVGQNVFVWSITWTNGTTTDTVIVNVLPPLAPANAGTDQTICALSAQLSATAVINLTATWTLAAGAGTFVNANDASTIVNNLGIGNNVFVWTVTNNLCPSVSDTVVYTVTPNPTPSFAGTDVQVCGTAAQLNADAPVTGIGNWINVTANAILQDTLNRLSAVSNLIFGDNIFVWQIQNGVCANSLDTVIVTAFDNPIASILGSDSTVCKNELKLAVRNINAGFGTWSIAAGGALFNDLFSSTPDVSGLTEGSNIFVWTVTNGVCNSVADTIEIMLQSCPDTTVFIPEGFSPNGDGTNDQLIISGVGVDKVSVEIYNRWGSKVFESNDYQNNWGGELNGSGNDLLDATYYYIIKISSEAKARTGYITLWR